ncbi:MAG: hypothetical protein A3E82_01370 [Gammaproteobacteria bacterium RIFCSPHIGHO2_12_FULL_38_11]|nr:MAG: hypothetical protein A3E82_01370 [Gammaproteobacteria bacterium RIFCSPHIGHO2_12_FULL_38_11]
MKILLTGGSGDLGKVLSHQIERRGDTALRFDLRAPSDKAGKFLQGSILDRNILSTALDSVDSIVHIAAWHGYHEFTKQKTSTEFWDVNVTGTFNIFELAQEKNIKNIVFISSESVSDKNGIYGWTKVVGEQIAQRYFEQQTLNIITLRPCGFIPYWNHDVYKSFAEWMGWFWKGYVHIDDVAQAVMKSLDLLNTQKLQQHLVLPVDRAYEYTEADLKNWDKSGAGTTFKKHYESYYDLAIKYNLDPAAKPKIHDIASTRTWLGYEPQYNLTNALKDLLRYDKSRSL